MYKLVVFATLLAVASAAPGLYGAPLAAPIAPWGHGIVSAPYVSGVVKTAVPVATSYANSVRIASPAYAAPAYAAPAYAAHAYAAPAYAHAPIVAAHAW